MGRVLSGPRHELVVTRRLPGHLRAVIWAGIAAGFAVLLLGL